MSKTYSIVCRETRQKVWIGQCLDKMISLYTKDELIMGRLRDFLNETQGKNLEFICNDDTCFAEDFNEFGEIDE